MGGYSHKPGPRYDSAITGVSIRRISKSTHHLSPHSFLTRFKTTRDDKSIHSRPLIFDSACYLHSKAWSTGRKLLIDTATFERDFLLPAPSTNYHGIVRSELRYAIASAMQNRVLSSLSIVGSHVFTFPVTQYWTPHFSRTFLPSATLLLDFPKHQRVFWVEGILRRPTDTFGQPADRSQICKGHSFVHYTRKFRTLSLNKTWPSTSSSSLRHSASWLHCTMCILLRSPVCSRDLSDTVEQPDISQPLLQPPVVPGPPDPPVPPRPVKRQKQASLRTEILGSNPKEMRAQIRATLDPGYCLCRSGKKKLRTRHRLGDCFALPDVDYLDYDFLGTSMPKRSVFDVICQLCAEREIKTAKEVPARHRVHLSLRK